MLTLTPQFAPPQLMADLKKENFSLKLKIYYLETTLSKVSGVEEFDVLAEVRGFVSLYVCMFLWSCIHESFIRSAASLSGRNASRVIKVPLKMHGSIV